jgi:acyl carrier protein
MSSTVLVECFVEALGIDEKLVLDDLEYNSIAQWDSVAHMTLVVVLEERFDIMLDTDDIIDMSSVANVKKILKKYEVTV